MQIGYFWLAVYKLTASSRVNLLGMQINFFPILTVEFVRDRKLFLSSQYPNIGLIKLGEGRFRIISGRSLLTLKSGLVWKGVPEPEI